MAMQPDTARFKGSSPASEAASYSATTSTSSPPPTTPDASLELRALGLERTRGQLAIRLVAKTNLGSYRLSTYPVFVRSYRELALLAFALTLRHPETIVHAVPVPFPALVPHLEEEPSDLVLAQAQQEIFLAQLRKWLARTTSDPALVRDAEMRRFVEADYSYAPHAPDSAAPAALRKRFAAGVAALHHAGTSQYRPAHVGAPVLATSTAKSWAGAFLSLAKGAPEPPSALATARAVHDQDPALVSAREEVTRLELQYAQAAAAGEKARLVGASQRSALVSLGTELDEWGQSEKLRTAATKVNQPRVLEALSHALRNVAAADAHCAARTALTLGDMLTYQSLNARSAKEALLVRASLVEQQWTATQVAAQRKAIAEAARSDPERAENALEAYRDAASQARGLSANLAATSNGLRSSLRSHSRAAHADLADALMAHATQGIRSAQAQLSHLQSVLPLLQAPLPVPPVPEAGGSAPAPDAVPITPAATVPPAAVPTESTESVPVPPSNLTTAATGSTASLTPTPTPAPGSTPTSTSTPSLTPTPTPTPTLAPAPAVAPNTDTVPPAKPQEASTSTSPSPAQPDRIPQSPPTQPKDPYRLTNAYSHPPHPSPFSRIDPPVPSVQSVGQGQPPTTGAARADWGSRSLYAPSNDSFSFGQARFGSGSFGAAARARQAAAQGKGGSFGSKARQASGTPNTTPASSVSPAAPAGGAGGAAGTMAASVPSLPTSGSTGSLHGPGSSHDGKLPPSSFGSAAGARSRLSARDAAKSLAGAF